MKWPISRQNLSAPLIRSSHETKSDRSTRLKSAKDSLKEWRWCRKQTSANTNPKRRRLHFTSSTLPSKRLVAPLYSDIKPGGGATCIPPDGIDIFARYLAAHPEGVIPEDHTFRPSFCGGTYEEWQDHPGYWNHRFVELTGETGDVVLMHPFMMHSASKNVLRIPRVITNPPVSLREPFNFNRDDPRQYSLVERKTLKALEMDKLDFTPTIERKRVIPRRVMIQQEILKAEQKRLEEARHKPPRVDSGSPVVVTVA